MVHFINFRILLYRCRSSLFVPVMHLLIKPPCCSCKYKRYTFLVEKGWWHQCRCFLWTHQFIDDSVGFQNPTYTILDSMQPLLHIVFVTILLTGSPVHSYPRTSLMSKSFHISHRTESTHRPSQKNCVATSLLDELRPASEKVSGDGTTFRNQSNNLLFRLSRLLSPGEGQISGNRAALHASNSRRSLSDPQMWTHIFFLLNGLVAYQNKIYDLCLLILITAPLSVVYHHSYEKPGKLAQLEGTAAKALFTYGLIQIFRAPTSLFACLEILMMVLTVIIFVGTNLKPNLYDPYHCFMHVIPPIWATVVALTHTPILKIF